ncbi:MAG: TPM domain-containing protein [Candidatus Omnitrophota bacterium]
MDGSKDPVIRKERSSLPRLFFSKQEKDEIMNAIRQAEKNTSGEVRLHLERMVLGDILEHAKKVFEKLKMDRTAARNGVLIFLGLKNKRFSILGDKGINDKVPDGFWNDIVSLMSGYFRDDKFAEGISEGIQLIGEKLKEYFPYRSDDKNELSDDISIG